MPGLALANQLYLAVQAQGWVEALAVNDPHLLHRDDGPAPVAVSRPATAPPPARSEDGRQNPSASEGQAKALAGARVPTASPESGPRDQFDPRWYNEEMHPPR